MYRGAGILLLLAGSLLGEGPGRNFVSTEFGDSILPQVADGGGWSTRITLLNMESEPARYTLFFYTPNGLPWLVPLVGQSAAASVSGTIPVGGSVFLETANPPGQTSTGWAQLQTEQAVAGMGVFQASWLADRPEAVVPFANQYDQHLYMPFDNRNGYVTSLAFANPSEYVSVTFTLEFRDTSGRLLLLEPPRLTLPPRQKIALETSKEYGATQGKNGVIEVKVQAGDYGVAALGLLFNPWGNFTSVHALSR